MLDGTILPGITRQSILDLTKDDKRFVSCEKKVTVKDLLTADKEKRVEFFLKPRSSKFSPVEQLW